MVVNESFNKQKARNKTRGKYMPEEAMQNLAETDKG